MRRLGPVAAVVLAATVAACSGDSHALDPAGRGAAEIADLWWLLFVPGTAVSVLVIALLLRAARGRGDGEDEDGKSGEVDHEATDRRWVVWGGVVLPLVVLCPLAVVVFRTSDRLGTSADDGELTIEVVGHQYWWEVRYPDDGVVTANEIHVPVGREVRLDLTTADVIHSFWVPNLHGKVDMIPGETTHLLIEATRAGEYRGACAEFCGIQHTGMRLLVVASEPDEFDAWLSAEAADAAEPEGELAQRGRQVFGQVGCASCHTVAGHDFDGEEGPDLTHLARRRTLGAGVVPNGRGELAGWVSDPQAVKPGNLMPPSALDADDLRALLAYLEGLG